MNIVTKNNLGRKGFVWLTFPHHSASSLKKNWAVTEIKTIKECCCLPLHNLSSLLLFTTQDHLQKGGTTHSGLLYIKHESRKLSANVPTDNLKETFLHLRSLFLGNSILCQVNKSNNHEILLFKTAPSKHA